MDYEIRVKFGEYRPCLVDGQKAIFHRWSLEDDAAIIEFLTGDVKTVDPSKIKFADSEGLFNEYDWDDVNVE